MKISKFLEQRANQYVYSIMSHRLMHLRYDDCEIELKHCPICKGEATLELENPIDSECNYITAHIECKTCGLQTRSVTVDGYYGDDHKINDVIHYWNDRVE